MSETRRGSERFTFATPIVCVTGPLEVLEGAVELDSAPDEVMEAESKLLELS